MLSVYSFSEKISDIDDLDGLEYYYGVDVPSRDDESEWADWYNSNYERIYEELLKAHDDMEAFLKKIDKKYKTSFAPTGALRVFYFK